MEKNDSNTMSKLRRSITISKDLAEWIEEQIEEKRFKDFSHALEFAVYQLKKETEQKAT